MGAFHPTAERLPTEFPVFPLEGALLLPRGRLPLNIFEPRYLAMVEDSLAAGRMFGMIQPDSSAPRVKSGPALFRVGCLGRLSYFSETEDGRFLITLTGLIRFFVTEELPLRRGYRRVSAAFDRFLGDLDPNPRPAGIKREALLSATRAYFAKRSIEANWEVISRLPEDKLVVTLAMSCPFTPAEKQAILESGDEAARAAALLALLQMGAADEEASGRGVS
jgi:Lon protease-like protein